MLALGLDYIPTNCMHLPPEERWKEKHE